MKRIYLSLMILVVAGASALAAPDTLRYPQAGEVFFTQNNGQWNEHILFATMQSNYQLSFTEAGMFIKGKRPLDYSRLPIPGLELLESPGYQEEELHLLRFLNRSPNMKIVAEDRLGNKTQFYLKGNASDGITDVPSYGTLVYKNVWEGIDILYTNNGNGIRQKVVLHEGADPNDIRFGFADAYSGVPADINTFLSQGGTSLVPQSGGGYALSKSTVSGSFYLFDFEFGSIYGGTRDDWIAEMVVDDAGNLYGYGGTGSPDLPLVNAFESNINHPGAPSANSFVMGISATTNDLLFSTYLNQYVSTHVMSLAIAPNQTIWLTALVDNFYRVSPVEHFPFTPDAKFTSSFADAPPGFIQLDMSGQVQYASLFRPDSAGYNEIEISFDRNGYVIICVQVRPSPPRNPEYSFITSGTIRTQRSDNGGYDLLLLKYDIKNDNIVFGTFINRNNDGGDFPMDIATDSENNIVVLASYGDTLQTWVNPFAENRGGDTYLIKLDSMASKVVWSSPSPGAETWLTSIKIDDRDRVHAVGHTYELHSPFQYQDPMPERYLYQREPFQNNQFRQPVYVRVSADGRLLKSTTFMGNSGLSAINSSQTLALDNCGNIYIYGGHISRIIPVFPRVDSADSHYLAVIDSGVTTLLYSTNLLSGNPWPNVSNRGDYHRAYVNEAGTVFFAGNINRTVPTQNAFETEHQGSIDAFIGKLHIPMCNRQETCAIRLPDTLKLFRRNGVVIDRSFDIQFELYNNGARPLSAPLVELSIDPGITLVNPTSNTALLQPDFVSVFDTARANWSATIDPAINSDTVLDIHAITTYGIVSDSGSFSICNKLLPVKFIDIPEYHLTCSIGAPDVVPIGENNDYDPNPLPVSVTLHNSGTEANEIKKLVVRYESDPSIVLVPLGDSLRYPGSLLPNDDYTATFMFTMERRSRERTLTVEFIAYDQYGLEMTRCLKQIIVPPLEGLDCTTLCTDTVHYSNDKGISVPNPINASVEIYNLIDTTQKGVQTTIDFSNAPHLQLPTGISDTKSVYDLPPGNSHVFTWEIEVVPPVPSDVTEEVLFITEAWTTEEVDTCVCLVSIVALSGDAACSIIAPDKLTVDDISYTPNPFDLDYILVNTGNAQLDVADITIQLPGYITTTDPLTQSVSALAPSAQHDITWSLTALTSAYDRDAVITVTAKDSEGNTLSVCEHPVFIPGVDALSCEAEVPLPPVFDVDLNAYKPNPFDAVLTVYNKLDSALTNVEVEATVSSGDVRIVLPNPPSSTQAVLASGQDWTTTWSLEVVNPFDNQTTIVITYRTRSDQYPEWHECSVDVTIPPRQYTYCADCTADGIDTVWSNLTNEVMLPVPFQVYTAVANNCTGDLSNVQCTIALPAQLQIVPGGNPVQTIKHIAPGDTMYAFWEVLVIPNESDYTADVQVQITSGQLSSPSVCNHTVRIVHTEDIQLNPAKKLVYFTAVQDGNLPAAKSVMVYAGFPTEMPWTASYNAWLDVSPSGSSTSESVSIQPNTTSLPYGRYWGKVDFASAQPNAPKFVDVVYDVVDVTGVGSIASAANGLQLHANYPNPFSHSTTIKYTTQSAQPVTITVYNTLGVPIRVVQRDAQPGNNTAQIDGLKPGIYMLVLQGKDGVATRMVIAK